MGYIKDIIEIIVPSLLLVGDRLLPYYGGSKPVRGKGIGITMPIVLVSLIILLYKILAGGCANAIATIIQVILTLIIYEVLMLVFYKALRRVLYSYHIVILWVSFCFGECFQNYSEFPGVLQKAIDSDIYLYIVGFIWLLGAIIAISIPLMNHRRFVREINLNVLNEVNTKTSAIFSEEKKYITEKYNIDKFTRNIDKVDIKISGAVTIPVAVGVYKRTIILPNTDYSEKELRLIFRHELVHMINFDNDLKMVMVIVTGILWFLPFMKKVQNLVSEDIELACDEFVTEEMTTEEKNVYVELILRPTTQVTGFTTCLSATAEGIRYRLSRIINPKEKKHENAFAILIICTSWIFIGFLPRLLTLLLT